MNDKELYASFNKRKKEVQPILKSKEFLICVCLSIGFILLLEPNTKQSSGLLIIGSSLGYLLKLCSS